MPLALKFKRTAHHSRAWTRSPAPLQMGAKPCRCRCCVVGKWDGAPFLFIPEAAVLRVPLSHYIFARDDYNRKGTCVVKTTEPAVGKKMTFSPSCPAALEQVPRIGERLMATEGSPAAHHQTERPYSFKTQKQTHVHTATTCDSCEFPNCWPHFSPERWD